MEKKWVVREQGESNSVRKLAEALKVSTTLANLMVQRGIYTAPDASKFFQPSLENLHDPFEMKGMVAAVERVTSAIERKERILIYGDYDVDGTTAVAMMYSFLRDLSPGLLYYIPDRYREGYGVSSEGLDFAAENNCKLVITLDCGIKSTEKMKYARSKGLDVIICDHHYPGDEIPQAAAVLDPKQPGCRYPYKELSGCGVGFKLMQAYCQVNGIKFSAIAHFLDLVAVSIASDIVPITGENRIMAYYGLKQLNSSPRTGLKEIIRESGISKELAVEDVVFKIGPRINAAGRMETGSKAVSLLISENQQDAAEISREISSFNTERRTVDRIITSEAMRMISDDARSLNNRTTVLYNPEWRKGVIGIVASRLIEIYYRPTVILTESNGFATGSARSVMGYDLYKAVEACADLLESFGGHMFAAGLTMKKENINRFRERFEEYVTRTITDDQLIPRVIIDSEIDLEGLNEDFYNEILLLQPFGPENMAPVFMATGVKDSGGSRMVGASGEHLKLEIARNGSGNAPLQGIAFGQANHFEHIHSGKPFDICFSLEMNEFRGNRNLQLNIKDIKTS